MFADCVHEAFSSPIHEVALKRLAKQYGSPKHPFELHLAPGVGTFEQYALIGTWSGASADGRRAAGPIGSDLSAAPVPHDKPATHWDDVRMHARPSKLADSLRSYANPVMARLGDGAPIDYNIPEDLPLPDLINIIRRFANGQGGSICTFTAANPETFAAAQNDPERYNLVRVRMGGWTEFFITLFPDHQEQHKRRPLYD
jgi:pyruvate-formate lyase